MNWIERIKAAKKRGQFEAGEVSAALRWPTCAVGECRRGNAKAIPFLPSETENRPIDMRLFLLGAEFYAAVREQDFSGALRLYRAISRRTKRLIAAKGGK